MTETTVVPDLTTIEDLDFPIPCSHSEHPTRHPRDEPAAYVIAFKCPKCGRAGRLTMCATGWVVQNRDGLVWDLEGCGARQLPISETMWVVEVLR